MFPLVSIFNLITLPFLIFIASRLYASFRKTKNKNIGYFFVTFVFLIILEALLASPGLILKGLINIGVVFAIYPFFGLLSLAFLGLIPFNILGWKKAEKFFLLTIIIISFFITIINLIKLQPAVIHYQQPFIYWEDTRGMAMNFFIGIFITLILLYISAFFIFNGLKSSDRYIRKRSFLISGGAAGILLATIINFVLGVIGQKYINSLISTFLLILSSIIIFVGVYYKSQTQEKLEETSFSQIKKDDYPQIQW